eukprot:superscaffoldBa00001826_g12184
MKWWFLCWLILSLVSQTLENNQQHGSSIFEDYNCEHPSIEDIKSYMTEVTDIIQEGDVNRSIEATESFEKCLENTELNETTSISRGRFTAVLYKPTDSFNSLNIYANETKALTETAVTNSTVSVQLPSELDIKSRNTVVFCMITCPEKMGGKKGELYEGRLVGLSVREKNISGLHERVNITMNLTKGVNETENPICMFLNFSTKDYSDSGCRTLWERGQSHITCSCNHLTYFAVLLVSASTSPADKKALGYITLIGCSISLVALVITVVLFFSKRKARSDVSMKVHINLAIALILLNLHFLPSKTVAALSSSGFCLYMALCLHYSLLATFSWMAVEGFHLYLLLVRVFNIYVQKYLLKLSLVGWGIPAVIVALVVIIDRDAYGRVPLDFSDPNSTKITEREIIYNIMPMFKLENGSSVNSSLKALSLNVVNISETHLNSTGNNSRIQIEAPQLYRGAEVLLVITVLNSTYFKLSLPRAKGQGRAFTSSQPTFRQDTVMGESVLVVKAGNLP